MPSSFELAAAAVGIVSVYHIGAPKWLKPPVRPLSCGFCLSVWVSTLIALVLQTPDAVLAVPIAGLWAALLTGYAPWAFAQAPDSP